MPKVPSELNGRQVRGLRPPGLHAVNRVQGLHLIGPAPQGAILKIQLLARVFNAETLMKNHLTRLAFELTGKSTSGIHLNTPPLVVDCHLKACPKSANHKDHRCNNDGGSDESCFHGEPIYCCRN